MQSVFDLVETVRESRGAAQVVKRSRVS